MQVTFNECQIPGEPFPVRACQAFQRLASGVTETQHSELHYRAQNTGSHQLLISETSPRPPSSSQCSQNEMEKSNLGTQPLPSQRAAPSLPRHPAGHGSRLGQHSRLRREVGAATEAPSSRWDQLPAALPGSQALLCLQAALGSAGDAKGWARE